ncbi:MAG: PAS domain-containing protein [Myxococcaceae bacterium]|nr:PAS domain-containing protein [Myxococcaceae bacterium]
MERATLTSAPEPKPMPVYEELAMSALQASERRLRDITDAMPVLVSYIDHEHRYRFVNETYRQWFGLEPAALIGAHMREVLGDAAYGLIRSKLEAALAGTAVQFIGRAEYRHGGPRDIEVAYTPHRSEKGEVLGITALVHDITEKVRLREATAASARKNERLLKVTAAIANAVTAEQVYEAIVDQAQEAVGAKSAGLWVLGDDGQLNVVRMRGYPDRVKNFEHVHIDSAERFPLVDALRNDELMWFPDVSALGARYPHLVAKYTYDPKYQATLVPLHVRGKPRGTLAFAFEGLTEFEGDVKPFVQLVARYASQALERLELLENERVSRGHAELLFSLAQTVIRAEKADDMFAATLDVIEKALGAKRSAILVFDAEGVMRFRASRGLSDAYRAAVEGHTPWRRDAVDPQPWWVNDAAAEPALAQYRELFEREKIGALGFIPLVSAGKLLGKFMLYFDRAYTLGPREAGLVQAIANHIAAATARSLAHDELQQTVRFNEMFTAILGHDLRNPLGSIMTAAQLLMKRSSDERMTRPLGRIMSSGGRMARMIDQLLDFARLRVGAGLPMHVKLIDVKPVLELAVGELAEANPETPIDVEVLGETVGEFDGDRLAQVFSNLVGNAVQHGGEGGPVTVKLDGRAAKVLSASVHNGGLIAAERLKRLFEPMNGTQNRNEKSQGLGLGLHISRQIARAHGGAIEVESSAEAGTTFRVTLPRAVR